MSALKLVDVISSGSTIVYESTIIYKDVEEHLMRVDDDERVLNT